MQAQVVHGGPNASVFLMMAGAWVSERTIRSPLALLPSAPRLAAKESLQ